MVLWHCGQAKLHLVVGSMCNTLTSSRSNDVNFCAISGKSILLGHCHDVVHSTGQFIFVRYQPNTLVVFTSHLFQYGHAGLHTRRIHARIDQFINEYHIDHLIQRFIHITESPRQTQYQSVVSVFTEKEIPHRKIEISDHQNPLNLIELFSYFILETILLGKMMNINPYGQPEVQLLKDKVFKN